ncbi:MAG: ribosome biogenesis GTP-binding protein YihA/YsxC [Christensenellales bacterium]
MKIKTIKFLKSSTTADNSFNLKEIAIVGRSNVGKSSLINYLTNSKIAKASSSPGRTRLINYFSVNNDQFLFVDLPGYGYNEAGKANSEAWGKMMDDYFKNSQNLVNCLLLLDIRHKPNDKDLQMINYLVYYNIPFTIVATKADKLSKAEQGKNRQMLATYTKQGISNIYVVSSLNRTGGEELLLRIEQFI